MSIRSRIISKLLSLKLLDISILAAAWGGVSIAGGLLLVDAGSIFRIAAIIAGLILIYVVRYELVRHELVQRKKDLV